MTEVGTRPGLGARDIVVGYGKNAPILDGLSLDVLTGELTVIVGPNACGKSTLLRSLSRVLDVRRGVVELDGSSVADMNQKALARRLGLLAQSSVAPGDMLVEDLVARGRYPYQSLLRQWSREDDEAVARAMEDAGVVSLVGRRLGELSGGQRQRIAIARGLVGSRSVILADEPTGALDSHTSDQIMLVLRDHVDAGAAGILVTHEARMAAWADRTVFLRDGRIVDRSRGDSLRDLLADTAPRI